MKQLLPRIALLLTGTMASSSAFSQISSLLDTFDPGTRSRGMGSSLTATDAEGLSSFNNPAALGYLTHREFELSYRNLPRSTSTVDSVAGQRSSTITGYGPSVISALAYVMPISRTRNLGAIGFSYSVQGIQDDRGTSAKALPYAAVGNDVAKDYSDRSYAKTDFYTVGFGRSNTSQTNSYGISLAYAQQYLEYQQSYDVFDDSQSPATMVTTVNTGFHSGTENGIGAILGCEFVPPKIPNVNFGASLRTPIHLTGGGDVNQYYGTIPGRILLGASLRTQGYRRSSDDYVIYGAQVEEYYGGSGSGPFHQDPESVEDLGAEYGLSLDSIRIPLRIGYRIAPSMGLETRTRQELTFGIGIRDKSNRFGLDLNFSQPTGGAHDFSLTASYRFKNS